MKTKQSIEHLAIIMDGNGRWAKKQGLKRVFGHRKGVNAVREAIEGAAELEISYLTLYAFSTENWNRPQYEINALMDLLAGSLEKELPTLQENNISLRTIGDIESLPATAYRKLQDVIQKTESNTGLQLVLALSYSARWEIGEALKKIAKDVEDKVLTSSEVDQNTMRSYLCTHDIPDPELMIRTSGESRISNFLLWQMAYTELIFLEKFWPEFTKADLFSAVEQFKSRERRFGKTSEQIKE